MVLQFSEISCRLKIVQWRGEIYLPQLLPFWLCFIFLGSHRKYWWMFIIMLECSGCRASHFKLRFPCLFTPDFRDSVERSWLKLWLRLRSEYGSTESIEPCSIFQLALLTSLRPTQKKVNGKAWWVLAMNLLNCREIGGENHVRLVYTLAGWWCTKWKPLLPTFEVLRLLHRTHLSFALIFSYSDCVYQLVSCQSRRKEGLVVCRITPITCARRILIR